MNLVLWIMTMRVKITADIWWLKVNDIPGGSDGKESICSAGDLGSISGLGRSFGEGNDYPLQYSSLKNSMDRGAWWATVHEVRKSWTGLVDFHFHFHHSKHCSLALFCHPVINPGAHSL